MENHNSMSSGSTDQQPGSTHPPSVPVPPKKRVLPPDWGSSSASKGGSGKVARPPAPVGSAPLCANGAKQVQQLRLFSFSGGLSYVSDARQCESFEGIELLHKALAHADAHASDAPTSEQPSDTASSSSSLSAGAAGEPAAVVVGFDLEWTVSFQAQQRPGKTAVVQLALGLPARVVFVFHVAHLQGGLPGVLRAVLCHPRIKKVGCGVQNDVWKLAGDFGDELEQAGGLKGFWELSELANARYGGGPHQRWSLSGLVERCMGQRLDKPQHVRTGNWDRRPLSAEQLGYAASDAWASLRVYEALLTVAPHPTRPPTDINHRRPLPLLLPLPAPATAASCSSSGEGQQQQQQHAHAGGGVGAAAVMSAALLSGLAPSKREAYELWHGRGLTLAQVAQAKGGIKLGTVAAYLSEAMARGLPYHWDRLRQELGPALVQQVEAAYHTAAAAASSRTEEEGGTTVRLGDVRRELTALQQQQQQQQGAEDGATQGEGGASGQQQQLGWWEVGLVFRHLDRQRQQQKAEEEEAAGGKGTRSQATPAPRP